VDGTDGVREVRVEFVEDGIGLGRLGEGAGERVEDRYEDEDRAIWDGETGYVTGG
jgi:hypothetical protein